MAAVGSIPEGAPDTAAWKTYVWVQDADETASRVTQAGGTTLVQPFDVMDSGRMAAFADPEGAAFCVWQPGRHLGAQIGGTVVVAPFDAPWVRSTVLADPAGATFIASRFEPDNRDVAPAHASASAA